MYQKIKRARKTVKKGRKALLFVNKKKQKNFECRAWGVAADTAPGPAIKSFLVLFFKKEPLPSSSIITMPLPQHAAAVFAPAHGK